MNCVLCLVFLFVTTITTCVANTPATLDSDNAGNLNLTATNNVNIHAPATAFDGFITVGSTVSVINVANVTQLLTAWRLLQGQPLSNPVTIQLAKGTYDLTTQPNNTLWLTSQPFGSFVTIKGVNNDASQVTFIGSMAFIGVVGLSLQWANFNCNPVPAVNGSDANPAIVVAGGSNLNIANVQVNGPCGCSQVYNYQFVSSTFDVNIYVTGNPYYTFCGFASSLSLSNSQVSANGLATVGQNGDVYCDFGSTCLLNSVSCDTADYGFFVDFGGSGQCTDCTFDGNYYSVVASGSAVRTIGGSFSNSVQGFVSQDAAVIFVYGPITLSNVGYLFAAYAGGSVFDKTSQTFTSNSAQCTNVYYVINGSANNGYHSTLCSSAC